MNLPADSLLVNIGRLALFSALFLTYPLLVHPCRASMHRTIFGDRRIATVPQHLVETVGIMGMALSVALVVPQVQVILGYAGSTFGVEFFCPTGSIVEVFLDNRLFVLCSWTSGYLFRTHLSVVHSQVVPLYKTVLRVPRDSFSVRVK